MERREIFFSLFTLFVFLNYVNGQSFEPTCPTPDTTGLQTLCTCSDNASPYVDYFTQCYYPQEEPGQGGEKIGPNRYLFQTGKSTKLGSYLPHTTLKIKNLSFGITYEISTQDRSSTSQNPPPFDTVLVLRNADGNVMNANDDCAYYNPNGGWSPTDPDSPPSYVTFTHTDILNDYVYVTLYEFGLYNCGEREVRKYAPIYIAAINDRDNDFPDDFYCDQPVLTCLPYTAHSDDFFDEDHFIDYTNPNLRLCGANEGEHQDLIYYFNGNQQEGPPMKYSSCDYIGTHDVKLEIYGKSCTVPLTVFPTLGCNDQKIFPNEYLTRCSFTGNSCPINPIDYPPLVVILPNECQPDPTILSFDLKYANLYPNGNNNNFVTIGSYLSFDITPKIGNELDEDTTNCVVVYYGIQPSALVRYNTEQFPDLIYNDDQLYFDTTYRIYYNASLDNTVGTAEITVVIISSGPKGDQDFYDTFYAPLSVNRDCVNTNLGACTSYSDFCIPSGDIEEGYYRVGLVTSAPPLSGSPNYFNPANPPPLSQSTKRSDYNNQDYLVSLGNPYVYISNDNRELIGEISCDFWELDWENGSVSD